MESALSSRTKTSDFLCFKTCVKAILLWEKNIKIIVKFNIPNTVWCFFLRKTAKKCVSRQVWYHVDMQKVHFSIFFYNLNIKPRPVLQQAMSATSPNLRCVFLMICDIFLSFFCSKVPDTVGNTFSRFFQKPCFACWQLGSITIFLVLKQLCVGSVLLK